MSLISKYNVPGPRYTSYPTVPYWNKDGISHSDWLRTVRQSFDESNPQGISLYIHLPFCENLCTFCGCHKRITKRHDVEKPYLETVLAEWKLYLNQFPGKPRIKEIHLGGGTPTFFSADNLARLIDGIVRSSEICEEYEFSYEGHPNHTTLEQLKRLYDLGFRRNSFGVQDYDPVVQKVINRIQPFDAVRRVHEWSQDIGYTSISHDLVFGLPKQTKESIVDTIEKTNLLRPDRISFYSYAHVPWIKGVGQRGFDESDLPKDEEKRLLYETGKEMFARAGYHEIGMDHFALPNDSLYTAMTNKTLHRNFMGYTTNTTQLMIGLGMSSISDSWYAFAQNEKSVEDYEERVGRGELPVFRGHLLNAEDLEIRRHILNLMCHFETAWSEDSVVDQLMIAVSGRLIEMENDGLIIRQDRTIKVTENGKPFVRNLCMAFDARLLRDAPTTRLFSMTV